MQLATYDFQRDSTTSTNKTLQKVDTQTDICEVLNTGRLMALNPATPGQPFWNFFNVFHRLIGISKFQALFHFGSLFPPIIQKKSLTEKQKEISTSVLKFSTLWKKTLGSL